MLDGKSCCALIIDSGAPIIDSVTKQNMEVCGYESLHIGGSFNSLYTTSVGYESFYIGGSFNSLCTTSVSAMLTLFSPSICFSYLLF